MRVRVWSIGLGCFTALLLAGPVQNATAAKQVLRIKEEEHQVAVGTLIGSSPEFSALGGPGLSGCNVHLLSHLATNDASKDTFGPGTLSVECEAGVKSNTAELQSVAIDAKTSGSRMNEETGETENLHEAKIKAAPLLLKVSGCSYVFKKLPAEVAERPKLSANLLILDGASAGKLNKKESAAGCASAEEVSYEMIIITGTALEGGGTESLVYYEVMS